MLARLSLCGVNGWSNRQGIMNLVKETLRSTCLEMGENQFQRCVAMSTLE
jgi:hypothetical protein